MEREREAERGRERELERRVYVFEGVQCKILDQFQGFSFKDLVSRFLFQGFSFKVLVSRF
jgi:hypothetical protein